MKETCEVVVVNGEEYFKKQKMNDEQYVIVRTYSAGVFAGHLLKREGKEVTLTDARRIWKWSGAATLSQLAMEGTKNPTGCKFPCAVEEILLTEAIEVINCTQKAMEIIKGVPVWQQ